MQTSNNVIDETREPTQSSKCAICNKTYKTISGLKKHQTKCKDSVSTNSENDTWESTINDGGTIEHQITIYP